MKKNLLVFLLFVVAACVSSCKNGTASSQPEVRNVIYMIGDGMGIGQVSALMISNGYEPVAFDRATAVGLVKTYSANNRVTDSSAAGTALASGTKTNNGWLGLDPQGNSLESIMAKASEEGYPTGIVVTCILPHATPGAFYGHVFSRGSYDTIAVQLLESDIDVAMGGGRRYFDRREDGRNLVEEFRNKDYNVIFDFNEAQNISSGKLVGMFSDGDMPYSQDGRGDYLPKATAKALEILHNNTPEGKGFFLMVEGSQIDYASHANDAERVKSETRDFEQAVGVAFDYADANPGTLVVVLADHETGGLSIPSGDTDFTAAESGISYNFGTTGHTGVMIPLYAYGAGAENFSRVMDNTDVPKLIEKLQLGLKK